MGSLPGSGPNTGGDQTAPVSFGTLKAFPAVTLSHAPPAAPADPPDDPSLIARVRQGDMNALSAIYQLHAAMLIGVAYRLTGSLCDAEDVVQDLFVGLSGALASYHERGRFPQWLRRLTVRLALMRLRADRRRREWRLEAAEQIRGTAQAPDHLLVYEALRRRGDGVEADGGRWKATNKESERDSVSLCLLAVALSYLRKGE